MPILLQASLRKCSVLLALLLLAFPISVTAQHIDVTGFNANGLSDALANDFLVPLGPLGPLQFDQEILALPDFTAGFLGFDYGTAIIVHAQEGTPHQPPGVSALIGNRAFIQGDNTSSVTITWKNTGRNFAVTDGHYAEIHSSQNVNVMMQVAGIPPGAEAIVYWRYDAFGGGSTAHESVPNVMEDSIQVTSGMDVNGTNQFPNNEFNFSSPGGLPGWNERKNITGNFRIAAGQNFTFAVNSNVNLWLDEPAENPPIGGGFGSDKNDGIFKGEITFTVAAQSPVVPGNVEDMLTVFSVDIGSDKEVSDPLPDGLEVFDPGDLYPKYSGPPLPAVIPWKDDFVIFAYDPDPNPGGPLIPAPAQSGIPPSAVQPIFFDLDGTDCLQMDLSGMAYGPGQPSVPWTADSCVFQAEFMFVSFDDDIAEHYTSLLPSVPRNSVSPFAGVTYSSSGLLDEVREFDYDYLPPSAIYFQDSTYSETSMHSNMVPNPIITEDEDDDIDALDMVPTLNGVSPCDVWYFSGDHEASFNHPSIPTPALSPSDIYQVTPAGPLPVITSAHHGLPGGTDIDAFEFAWVWDTAQARFGLALLFSVDDDDPLTADDESGGLSPRTLYYSFLDSSYHVFSPNPLADDIDAITIWHHSLNGTPAQPNPIWGTKTWTGGHNQLWGHGLNWFPQGVPFYPENVKIPSATPPAIMVSGGHECSLLEVDPGAVLRLHSGVSFTTRQ